MRRAKLAMNAHHEEPHVVSALVELCKKHEVKCLIQIGAEDGYEAACIKEATKCRAIAIEPNVICEAHSPHIEFYNTVIGGYDSLTTFYIHEDTGLSSQLPRNDGHEIPFHTAQQRLDTWCNNRHIKPDALIIDTEGTTLDVLGGCGDLLFDIKIIYAECQTEIMRPGIRLLNEVDEFLVEIYGMTQHHGLPSYSCENGQYPIPQGNWTWIREDNHAEAPS